MDGSIVRYHFKDFMTYSNVESFPHKHLNIISGGNGTGKSSVFNGILFCLNGKTTFVNRAKKIGDFIKHGSRKAVLEIELYNSRGLNYIISRTIFPDSSIWKLNNQKSSQKEIQLLVEKLNIQVDNLCQFLPQDRVADFAKMNPAELLENTQKAVDLRLYEKHQFLRKKCLEVNDLERQAKTSRELLDSEKSKNQRLEQEVQNFQSKSKYIEQINTMKSKEHWLNYSYCKEDYYKERTKLLESKNNLADNKKKFDEKIKSYAAATKSVQSSVNAFDQKILEFNEVNQSICKTQEECQSIYKNRATGLIEDFEMKKSKAQLSANTISQITREVATLDTLLQAEKEAFEAVQPQYVRLAGKRRSVVAETNENKTLQEKLKISIQNLTFEKQNVARDLEKASRYSAQTLENIRQKQPDVYRAYKWLEENRRIFKRKIIGPVSLYVKTKSVEGIQYLENQIGEPEWRALICFDKDDFNLLIQNLRVKQHVNIPIFLEKPTVVPGEQTDDNQERIYYGDETNSDERNMLYTQYINQHYPPLFSNHEKMAHPFASLFDCYIKDFIHSCPFEIAMFLCRKHHINEILVCKPSGGRNSFNNNSRTSNTSMAPKDLAKEAQILEAYKSFAALSGDGRRSLTPAQQRISSFYACNTNVRITRSRYRPNEPCLDQIKLRPVSYRIFAISNCYDPSIESPEIIAQTAERINILSQRIQEASADIKNCDSRKAELDRQIRELNTEYEEITKHKNAYNEINRNRANKIQRLEREKKNLVDVEKLKEELEKKLESINEQIFEQLSHAQQLIEKAVLMKSKLMTKCLTIVQTIAGTIDAKKELDGFELEYANKKNDFETLERVFETVEQVYKEKLDYTCTHIEGHIVLITTSQNYYNRNNNRNGYNTAARNVKEIRLKPESQRAFNAFPNDISSLADQISEIQARADLLTVGDHVMEEYRQRQSQIQALYEESTKKVKLLATRHGEIAPLKQDWLNRLKKTIGTITAKFSSYFSRINCVGEILLVEDWHATSSQGSIFKSDKSLNPIKHNSSANMTMGNSQSARISSETPSGNSNGKKNNQCNIDIQNYGLTIRVQFRREESKKVLNHKLQSGGERSVSTIFFLLALQELTLCPFRMVDEINQGMDSHNEAKVLELIDELSQKPDVPQYFLLTPKLLHNTKFGPHTKFLVLIRTNLDEKDRDTYNQARRALSEQNVNGNLAPASQFFPLPVVKDEIPQLNRPVPAVNHSNHISNNLDKPIILSSDSEDNSQDESHRDSDDQSTVLDDLLTYGNSGRKRRNSDASSVLSTAGRKAKIEKMVRSAVLRDNNQINKDVLRIRLERVSVCSEKVGHSNKGQRRLATISEYGTRTFGADNAQIKRPRRC